MLAQWLVIGIAVSIGIGVQARRVILRRRQKQRRAELREKYAPPQPTPGDHDAD